MGKTVNRFIKDIRLYFSAPNSDRIITIMVLILSIFGIIMIGSASVGSYTTKGVIVNMAKQTIYVIIGLVCMFFFSKRNMNRLKKQPLIYLYWIGIALMTACRLFGNVNGSYAWIRLGPVSIQPSEFMKIIMILLLSYYLSEIVDTMNEYVRRHGGRFPNKTMKDAFLRRKFVDGVFIPLLFVLFAAFIGVVVQKDFGTAAITFSICGLLFLSTTKNYYKKYKRLLFVLLGFAAVLFIIMSLLGFNIGLQVYQMNRFKNWFNPLSDPTDSGWQLINAMIAFTNGGIFGLGFGNSTQKFGYIPESHNDFIGAIIYEELGIFGLALILIPSCIIIHQLLKYSDKVEDNKSKLTLIGVASYLILHIFINLGGVSGLIPMTGVPLLLISAGGSSTIAFLIGIGICQGIISQYKKSEFSDQYRIDELE